MTGRILVGPKTSIVKKDKGFGELFFEKAQTLKDAIFQIHAKTGESETYGQVLRRSIRVAIGLQQLGVKEKDIVMLCCYNDLNNIVPWLASLFLGAVICSVGLEQDGTDIDAVISFVKPNVVFVVDDMLETIQNSLKIANFEPLIVVIGQSKIFPQMEDMENTATNEENTFQPAKINPYETAFIMLSSGTTSTPKEICLNQDRYLDAALNAEKNRNQYSYGSQLRILQKCSLYWTSGVLATYQIPFLEGAKVIAPKFTTLEFLESLDKYKVHMVIITGGSIYSINDLLANSPVPYDFSSLRILILGGSKVDKSTIVEMRKFFPKTMVFNAYGSTEVGVPFYPPVHDPKVLTKPETVGKVAQNVEIKIVDPETEALLGPNQEGEILVKSPFVMSGYYNYKNPDFYDKDGFFKTGDLGYYDEDEYFFITDRINETFKIVLDNYLSKILPSVVEAQLLLHPDVKSGVVFGIPDDKCIKLPAALVILKDGAKSSASDILEYVNNSGIPDSHKLRGGIKIVETLPETASEKIARRRCVDIFLSLP